jgi:hypothetical protein
MPVVRYKPGENAPREGTYAVTTEWLTTEVAVWCRQGERLPLITAAVEGPLWYVLIELSDEAVQAA